MKNEIKLPKENRFWDIIFYTSLLVLTIWVILKSIGVIHTPTWLEYGVPFTGLIFTALSFYQKIIEKVNTIAVGLATLNVRFDHLDKDVEGLKENMTLVKSDVSGLKGKI